MNIQIIQALDLTSHPTMDVQEFTKCKLPEGFRFLVTEDMKVVEPVLLFLYDHFVKSAKRPSVGNSQKAYCADLYEFFAYLHDGGLRWNEISESDLDNYNLALRTECSNHTGRRYAPSTISRRFTVLALFYEWAFAKQLVFEPIEFYELKNMWDWSKERFSNSADSDGRVRTNKWAPKVVQPVVEHLKKRELNSILDTLGPPPPKVSMLLNDYVSVRDRLVAVTAVITGMRLSEVLALGYLSIMDLQFSDPDDPFERSSLVITETKGGIPRNIYLPQWVHKQLIWYINNERRETLEEVERRYGKQKSVKEVFLNTRGKTIGRPLQSANVIRRFKEAVISCGFVRQVEYAEPKTGGRTYKEVPKYTFHALRHTFAVYSYYSLRRYSREPWKDLQILLGHRRLQTTIDTYLRSVSIEEANISDELTNLFLELADA